MLLLVRAHIKSIKIMNLINILTKIDFFLISGHAVSTPTNKRIDILYSLLGCALFITAGVLIIEEWNDAFLKNDTRKMALTKGGLAIVNGVIFFIDAIFTFRD